MLSEDADGIANINHSDQTAPLLSDLGLHCLFRLICPSTCLFTAIQNIFDGCWDNFCHRKKKCSRDFFIISWESQF